MALNEHSLGKTLNNVFARTSRKESPAAAKGSLEVDLNLIRPPSQNPRQQMSNQGLQELADSITAHGVLQPIVVLRQEGGYEVLAGERRYRAAKLAGLQRVPVTVRDEVDPSEIAQLRLIENIQREDLNPIDVAQAYRSLIDEFKLTQEQVATQVGKDRSSVSNSLRLLTLPPKIQPLVADGSLSMGHARALAGMSDEGIAISLARRIVDEGLSVRAVERLVREAAQPVGKDAKPSAKPSKPAHLRELEQNLSRLFDAEVVITERQGKGKISVSFHSKGHFKDIVDLIDQAAQDARRQARM